MSNSKKKKLSRDGLPVDPKQWTRSDWKDLHEALEQAKKSIRDRHKGTDGK